MLDTTHSDRDARRRRRFRENLVIALLLAALLGFPLVALWLGEWFAAFVSVFCAALLIRVAYMHKRALWRIAELELSLEEAKGEAAEAWHAANSAAGWE